MDRVGVVMSPEEAERLARSWLASERIEIREQDDPRAHMQNTLKARTGICLQLLFQKAETS